MAGTFIFGMVDLFAAVSLLFLKFGFFEHTALFFIILLGIKAVIFIKSFASLFDIVTVVFLVLAYFGFYYTITWICFAWLLQKGIFSLFSS